MKVISRRREQVRWVLQWCRCCSQNGNPGLAETGQRSLRAKWLVLWMQSLGEGQVLGGLIGIHCWDLLIVVPKTTVAPAKRGPTPAGAQSLVAHGSQNLFLVLHDDIQGLLIFLDLLLIFQDDGLVLKNRLLVGEDFCF